MTLAELVTLNGKHYKAYVYRQKRQIVFVSDVPVGPADVLIVNGMTGPIETVEQYARYTIVTLGGSNA